MSGQAGKGRRAAPWRDDRGSESVELAILLPVVLVVLTFLVIGARLALAGNGITGVAGAAARAASIARDTGQATQSARQSATTQLDAAGLHCTDVRVVVDTSGFATRPGGIGTVAVDVWCTVNLSDIAAPGLPGARTLHDRAVSPVDLRGAP